MYYCGIDVAKRKHAIALLDEHGQPVQRPFTIENTRAGFDQLLQALAALKAPVLIGLEATGHYWWALYDDLTHHDQSVVVLNALQVHAFRKSGVRKVKSDRTDAVWIAEFLRFSQPEPAKPTTAVFLQLKDLSRFRYHLSDQVGDCKRKLLSVLDRVFPEYETLFSSVFLSSSRQLLVKAASAQELATFDLSELTDLLTTASRGRFDRAKAEAVQTLAKQSVGVSFWPMRRNWKSAACWPKLTCSKNNATKSISHSPNSWSRSRNISLQFRVSARRRGPRCWPRLVISNAMTRPRNSSPTPVSMPPSIKPANSKPAKCT